MYLDQTIEYNFKDTVAHVSARALKVKLSSLLIVTSPKALFYLLLLLVFLQRNCLSLFNYSTAVVFRIEIHRFCTCDLGGSS